ncbi:MAG: hypothetical protein H0U76_19505 [Ktedonobacteraceae bacterium]|nr:hypothetical protein [Ktedonobacteraceae bacterium]
MKHLRLLFSLALVPLCTFLSSFIAIRAGSAVFIGLVVGIALSYLFFTYGPSHSKDKYPKSYYLNQQHQLNGGVNQQVMEDATLHSQEAAQMTRGYYITDLRH